MKIPKRSTEDTITPTLCVQFQDEHSAVTMLWLAFDLRKAVGTGYKTEAAPQDMPVAHIGVPSLNPFSPSNASSY